MSTKPRILVLHSLYETSRKTVRQHLGCYQRYLTEADVVYHHFRSPITPALRRSSFDLIVLNYCLLSNRVTKDFRTVLDLYSFLPQMGCPIVAVPQDDVICCAYLDEWLYRWDVDSIYTPREYGQDQIYVHSRRKSKIVQVLPGYVDENVLPLVEHRRVPWDQRTIDVGSRVRFHPYRCGWYGRLKGKQGIDFVDPATAAGFSVDISTDPGAAFTGMAWYDFLGNSRFTVARRGGSSLLDPYGDINKSINAYVAEHPNATFEEVESSCFPGLDSPTPFSAVTPRLFDAALMKTCMILAPDDYLGLEPYVHYLPLEDDFSNIEELFQAMRDRDLVLG